MRNLGQNGSDIRTLLGLNGKDTGLNAIMNQMLEELGGFADDSIRSAASDFISKSKDKIYGRVDTDYAEAVRNGSPALYRFDTNNPHYGAN